MNNFFPTRRSSYLLKDGLSVISLAAYWKSTPQPADDEDEYEEPTAPIPSICLFSFTGRAAQQVKSNFPTDWHSNIMTIHRMLGFYPEFSDRKSTRLNSSH